ncbi:MAG: CHAT domain-containing protein, partial [Bacteroidales bacterium]|nr:CHAT domain-containing protein [Bacteroidales bacterium]
DVANTIERNLIQRSQAFGEILSSFKIRWEDVKSNLKDDEAAIEFISFRYHDGKRWADSTYYCALMLTKNCKQPYMIYLFEEEELTALLPKPGEDRQDDYNIAYQGALRAELAYYEPEIYKGDSLYQLLWKPIDSLLQGVETVYFSSSGLLHTIAMAAIPMPSGGLLMDKYNLVQLSSTRQLALPDKPLELKDAVVYGGIQYDMDAGQLYAMAEKYQVKDELAQNYSKRSGGIQSSGFDYLKGSMQEAENVSALLGEKLKTRKITGTQAVEESFRALSGGQSPTILHIATHGFYFPDTISNWQREQFRFSTIGEEKFRYSEDPLMRLALVMAGANRAWKGESLPEGVQDGILTAKDVSGMNLGKTQLVVLSACQTGQGDVKGSEGVEGLQRAFKMAGVNYIMMSLWPVPDKETAEFMKIFYQHWLAGKDIREAFRSTQQQMHKDYPGKPAIWAAFVLVQ